MQRGQRCTFPKEVLQNHCFSSAVLQPRSCSDYLMNTDNGDALVPCSCNLAYNQVSILVTSTGQCGALLSWLTYGITQNQAFPLQPHGITNKNG